MAKLLRAKDVAAKRGRSRAQLYMDIEAGKFPKGMTVSPKVVVWDEKVVDACIEKEIAELSAKQQPSAA